MMRTVLHVVATLDRGGTEVSALAMAHEFARRGIVNHVVALDPGQRAIATDFEAVAGIANVLPRGRIASARSMRSLVQTHRPDAVLFHLFNIEHVVLGAAARSAGVRHIVTQLGNPVRAGATIERKVRVILQLTDLLGIRLVSGSRWIETSLREVGHLPKSALVIHYGCDIGEIGARADGARGLANASSEAVVGMVARLDSIKDHTTLIGAFSRMPATIAGRPTRLVLVGDGVLRAELEMEARRLGVFSRVTFAGARPDIPEMIARFDVFAFATTRDEGFGVVLVEALAAGVPIVASDVPACREVLEDGTLGRLVSAGDPEALAAALTDILARPPPVPARAEIARRYGIAATVDAYLAALFPAGDR